MKNKFRLGKKASELVEKIIMVAFSIAAGAGVIVYTGGVINSAKSGVKMTMESMKTRGRIFYSYTKNGENDYTYTNLKISYTGFMVSSFWDTLNAECEIIGYGMRTSSVDYLAGTPLKDAAIDGSNVRDYYHDGTPTLGHLTGKAEDQLDGIVGDCYYWGINKNIMPSQEGLSPDDIHLRFTKQFTFVAYVKNANNELIFFQEASESCKTIAQRLINEGVFPEDFEEGALSYIANQ